MKKIIFPLLTAFILLTIFSCKKDNTTSSSSPLAGNWKFISIHAQTQSTAQYSDAGSVYKTITNSAYTSTNNGGSVAITSNTMTGTGITYQVSDTAYGYDYTDNQLVDSISSPFKVNIPPVNSTASYQMIGQDSIYFTGQGGLFTVQGGSVNTTPSGAKFNISGNTLIMISSVVKDTTINSGGIPVSQHETAVVTTTLQKQ